MQHFGDITKIKGAEVPIVDVVTGGSPCQDLSVAGKRAGLAGERSGLFMEQIRVIKEMRDECKRLRATRGTNEHIRPRYMVWENVPGAFSSNKGEDFRAVLEETAKVVKGDARIPEPPNGRWPYAGCIMGDGWSIAWRLHDAQFWGVPQRRKRIALVADFGGKSAPEILFEREGVSRDIEESREEGQGIAANTERSIDKTSKCLNAWDVQSKHIQPENGIAEALYAGECRYAGGESYVLQNRAISFQERAGKPGGGKGILIQNERTGALSTLNNQSVAYCLQGNGIDRADTAGCNGKGWRENQSYTLNTVDRPAVCYSRQRSDELTENEVASTQSARQYKDATDIIVYGLDRAAFNQGGMIVSEGNFVLDTVTASKATFFTGTHQDGVAETLVATDYKDPQIVAYGVDAYNQSQSEEVAKSLNSAASDADHVPCVYRQKVDTQAVQGPGAVCQSVVRRLTPLECERLQGFPDHWTDIGDWVDSKGKKHKGESDSPRYKALGNSIALPFWKWMAKRMRNYLGDKPTMASLFDGIGGFPLSYTEAGVEPVWASEIEEFPIAVTKIRFPN